MIYTSYFAKLKKLPENITPISICGKAPDWYQGLQYKKLAPKYDFFMKWKQNHDNEYYIEHFQKEVLDTLNVNNVVEKLYSLLSDDQKYFLGLCNCLPQDNNRLNICLICYEKPTDFCHRHLVADWLTENGIQCKEIEL
jgi:uncharacterized protein (DUF488 family)